AHLLGGSCPRTGDLVLFAVGVRACPVVSASERLDDGDVPVRPARDFRHYRLPAMQPPLPIHRPACAVWVGSGGIRPVAQPEVSSRRSNAMAPGQGSAKDW